MILKHQIKYVYMLDLVIETTKLCFNFTYYAAVLLNLTYYAQYYAFSKCQTCP